jgi:hypothetical protein
MGGRGSGRPVDVGLRRRVLRLRAGGLTLERIAARLGVSRQTVWYHLRAAGACKRAVHCPRCHREVGPRLSQPGLTPAYCPDCLARHPDAPFAVRLKSCRAAAGLTVLALAGNTCTGDGNLRHYEGGRCNRAPACCAAWPGSSALPSTRPPRSCPPPRHAKAGPPPRAP